MLAQPTQKSRIVLLQDNSAMQHDVAVMLRRTFKDYDVRLTQDSTQALHWLADERSHLLITDAQTRKVDGLAVATSARTRRPGLPVIVLSDPPCDSRRTSQLSAAAWIEKPPKMERLIRLVGRALSERMGWSGQISIQALPDLVQLLSMANTSGALRVDTGPQLGLLWFDRGTIVDAKLGKLRGVEGFHALMQLRSGTFVLDRSAHGAERTIELSATQLLLETMCRIDKKREEESGVPPHHIGTSVSQIRLMPVTDNRDPTDSWSTPTQSAAECFERGLEHVRSKDYAQALAEWERANALDPENHTYQVNLRRLRDLHQRNQNP
jgi:CheY-like chemotaxis protein